jgi:hypothetical protein
MPTDFDKVPFHTDLNELWKDEQIYKAYTNLNIAHFQLYKTYDELLSLTDELLHKLDTSASIEKK